MLDPRGLFFIKLKYLKFFYCNFIGILYNAVATDSMFFGGVLWEGFPMLGIY